MLLLSISEYLADYFVPFLSDFLPDMLENNNDDSFKTRPGTVFLHIELFSWNKFQ